MKASNKMKAGRTVRAATAANPGLDVRTLTDPEECARFDALLEADHPLGATRPFGDFLRQVFTLDGEWIALLAWGSAALHLKDRDTWIGWNARLRKEGLKLVVNNRIVVFGNLNLTDELRWIGLVTNASGSWGGATNVTENTNVTPASVLVADPAATNRYFRLRVTRP